MSGSTSTPPARLVAPVLARVVRVLAGVLVLAAGVAVAAVLVATRPLAPRTSRSAPLLQVRTMPASEARIPRVWEGYGTVRPMRVAQIPAQVSGMVVERPAEVEAGWSIVARGGGLGSEIASEGVLDAGAYLASLREAAEGGLILRIDPSDYIARLRSALEQAAGTRAQLASLVVQETRAREMAELAKQEREIQERELGRLESAITQGGGNESEVERRRGLLLLARRNETGLLEQIDRVGPRRAELEANLREQESNAEVARQNLARTVVTSPIDGVLQEVMYRPGEWAQAGTPIARVVDLSRVEVPLRVPMAASTAVQVGDEAILRIDSRDDREWRGRVVRVSPEADPQTRTLSVYVEVEQTGAAGSDAGRAPLLPGQFVVGRIQTVRTERVMLVPRRAVLEDSLFVAAPAEGEGGVPVVVARRVGVDVLFNLVGERPDLDPVETQWSAVRPDGQLAVGAAIIVSNLDDLREGLVIGVDASGATGPIGGATP